jgi:hypothetical protein
MGKYNLMFLLGFVNVIGDIAQLLKKSVVIIPIMLNGRVSHQKRASEPLKRS